MKHKQLYVVVPFESRVHWYLKRLAPTWLLKKVARMFAAGLKAAAAAPERPSALKETVANR